VLPCTAFGPAAPPEAVTVTSVTVFPQYPGPRPLVPPPGGTGAVRAPAAGRPVSPPTHDQGGGVLPLVGVRRTPAATTERTGIGRGARLLVTLERAIAAQRTASRPGLIGYLLEAPWEEGVAANLPPPLLQVPPVSSAQDLGCPVAANDPVPPWIRRYPLRWLQLIRRPRIARVWMCPRPCPKWRPLRMLSHRK